MGEISKNKIKWLIFLFFGSIFVFSLAYSAGRQILRLNVNEPQAQISENAAAFLARGEEPEFLHSHFGKVDISESLEPFFISFDGQGRVLFSTALLDGKTPLLPDGIFKDAKKRGQSRLIWEPKKGLRMAAVIAYYGGSREGFALAGRSLSKIERQEERLFHWLFWSWLIFVVLLFFAFILLKKKNRLT